MNQQTILVVDDESPILSVVSLKLRNAGFRVLTASDGQEALDIALRERPDLLITDYQMPLLSGLELCQKIRQANASIPAILLTARTHNLKPANTANCGILRTVSKPFSPRQLLATVQEVLRDTAAAA